MKTQKQTIGFYIFMILGICIFTIFVDLGDSILVAGLECALGAFLGITAYHILNLLKKSVYK